MEYLKELTRVEGINIIPPNLSAYTDVLEKKVDYVGTSLHAGIWAMRNKVRSIIICVDQRMDSMASCMLNNCIKRGEIEQLDNKIKSDFETRVEVDWNAINLWKKQFR